MKLLLRQTVSLRADTVRAKIHRLIEMPVFGQRKCKTAVLH